ncbi:MAG: hypothetical protein KIPDCIKN_04347 [Haliscomenobacter sp.]|nr:hypothetical protein [Haliscomenobacter sp.]
MNEEPMKVPEAVTHHGSTLTPSPSEYNTLMAIANQVAAAKVFGISAELAFCKMLAGRELGLPPMAALVEVECYDGKLAMGAKGKVAVVRGRRLGDINLVELNGQRAVVKFRRAEWATERWEEFAYTWQDAETAGLTRKDNWRKNPRSMLGQRAQSHVCQLYFQDVFAGVPYSPDELGAETDEDGRVALQAAINPSFTKSIPGIVPKDAEEPKVAPLATVATPVAVPVEPPSAQQSPLTPPASAPAGADLPPAPGKYLASELPEMLAAAKVPAEKLAAAIAKRGVKHESELAPKDVDEIAEKLLGLMDRAAAAAFRDRAYKRSPEAKSPF